MAHLISIWSRISLLVETNCLLSNCWIVVTRRSDRSSVSICAYNDPKSNLTLLPVFPLKHLLQTVPLWVFNEDLSWISAGIWRGNNLVTLRIDNSFSMFVVTLTRIDNSFSMFVVTLTRIDNSFQVQVQVPLTKHTFTMPFRTQYFEMF